MLSPALIGLVATKYSIGLDIGLLGVSYAFCVLTTRLFIGEKGVDPQASEWQPPAA